MMKNKNIIRLTESELRNMIAEAATQTLNELSPEFIAGAYTKAKDLGFKATSPIEQSKRNAQADRLNKAAIDKYNARYGTKNRTDGGHKMTSLYYSPYSKLAYARTETADNAGTKQYTDYTNENPYGTIDKQYSTGKVTPKNPQLTNRAARGEKVITKALGDLKHSKEEPVMENIKLSESDLVKLVTESVNDILKQLNEGAIWDAVKHQAETLDGTEDMSIRNNWDEIKDVWRGAPNQSNYEQARMLRKSARFDRDRATTPAERDLYNGRVGRYAKDELASQPGLGGKLRRAGYMTGMYGAGLAKKIGGKLNRK